MRSGDLATAGPFATLLFSRTEVNDAVNCVPGIAGNAAGLITTVAPYMQSLGLRGTGTLVTGKTRATANICTHFGDSLTASWADATNLARNHGWSFVSHTADYPSATKLANLTPAQAYAETCGSAATIGAHGLPGGHGMIAYPGGGHAGKAIAALQDNYGSRCFAWGRQFNSTGVTSSAAATTAPYWQHTAVVNGGPCHDRASACYSIPHTGRDRYTLPSQIIGEIRGLRPGQWYTLQAYILVTGTSPPGSPIRWNCTSADPAEHWTSDEERYCWSDYQQILRALAAMKQSGGVTVTDPLTVGEAFGRLARHSGLSAVQHVVVVDMENHDLENLFGFPCAQGKLPGCPANVGMPPRVTFADGTTVTPYVMPDTIPNVLHNPKWELLGMSDQWDKISGCGPATTPPYACVGGYTAAQEPNLIALAKGFAWSSRTFGALTASWGSHLFTAASTLDGFTGANPTPVTLKPGWGCDSHRITTWGNPPRWVPACVPDYSLPAAQYPYGGAFKPTPAPYVPTVFDELHAKGLPWRIYGAGVPGGGPDTTAGGYIWSVCPTFAECLYTSQVKNLVPTAQFFTDAAAGNLPAYSVIAPGAGYASDAEHNKQSMAKGDNFLGQVASAMENSPDWGSTIMIITYDDFGGFYANPSPAPGTGPDGTRQGFRLPVVIVSPFARPGHVDTTPATQASITALVEQTFGLAPLGMNDRNAYAYRNALCLPPSCTQARARPVKMIRRPLPASARYLGNAGAYADS